MKFEVIIATYNRHDSLRNLINDILRATVLPERIIIVDSSTKEDTEIQKLDRVVYVRSSHGNQPYQRYIGYLKSEEEILVYFDDDVRILDTSCFNKILESYVDKKVVAVQPNLIYRNYFLQDKLPKSKIRSLEKKVKLITLFKYLTGNPILKQGMLGFAGIKGERPFDKNKIEWFYGPVFSVRREKLYRNFNFTLFDIAENKMGMGEDTILGYTISKQGKIIYFSKSMFLHDDQEDSVYTPDYQSYGERVAYSRLYLSYEYARLSDISKSIVLIHFVWYMLWRLGGMGVNYVLDPKKERKEMIHGYFSGIKKAIRNRKTLSRYDDGKIWKKEAKNDIEQ